MTKDEAKLEVAYDILSELHTNLCNDQKTEQAEEMFDILRRLNLLSQKIEKDAHGHLVARRCPECGADSYVVESRESADGTVYRRRECTWCGHRYATREAFDHNIKGKRDRLRPENIKRREGE